ncbi:polymeric immunoglobulin receptor-like [Hoplias malabaricus]|uniref:polymeric immunoglobulin receptor-like n=1 Tax=Hoplias malabaricus TaxID=27720 RepID=UPI003461B4D6
MKTLLIFTFFLISGPVGCFDVIGYPGGSVKIYCKQYEENKNYFCKKGTDECINVETQDTWVHKERLSLIDSPGDLTIIFRNLSLQDSGSYRCGETGGWSHDVELKVKRDPCCSSPRAVTGFLGETLTINCSYPEEIKTDTKFFYKQHGQHFNELIRTGDAQREKYSIFEDRSSKVVSVKIGDVREEDRGVYHCAVWIGAHSGRYYSLFSEIQLQIIVDDDDDDDDNLKVFAILRWTVVQCLDSNPGTGPNVEVLWKCMVPGLIEKSLDPRSRAPDTVYKSLNPNNNQSDSVYQSLNPNTDKPDSVYQSLDPNTNKSVAV